MLSGMQAAKKKIGIDFDNTTRVFNFTGPGSPGMFSLRVNDVSVNAGQTAEIKIEAFSYTRYGLVHGVVESVSRDALRSARDGPNPERDLASSTKSSPAGDKD